MPRVEYQEQTCSGHLDRLHIMGSSVLYTMLCFKRTWDIQMRLKTDGCAPVQ